MIFLFFIAERPRKFVTRCSNNDQVNYSEKNDYEKDRLNDLKEQCIK